MWTLCGHCKLLGQVVFGWSSPYKGGSARFFYEWCRVTRHPQLFRRLTGCQRTPRVRGVTWTISQHNSLENLPLKFLSQPFSFLFSFMSCTYTYRSRVPRCIWNALCHLQTIHANIFYMHILTKITHINHVIQFIAITSKLAHMG